MGNTDDYFMRLQMTDTCTSIRSKNRNLAKLPSLVNSIDPDIHYGDWLRVLMVIFYETRGAEEGFDLADSWSSDGEKYRGTREVRSKWDSFRLDHEHPVTIGTLIQMAKTAS